MSPADLARNLLEESERLNPQQREAVTHFGPPLLILAGAGSGKTRVISTKIAHLIEGGVLPARSILAVTFTNKAAEEMRARTCGLTPGATEVVFRTFHSFGAWMLRMHPAQAGLPQRFRILDEDDAVTLLSRVVDDAGEDAPDSVRRPWSVAELRSMAERISRAKDWCVAPTETTEGEAFRWLYTRYDERLHAGGAVDFGDLILLPRNLLRSHPDIRARMHERFRAILVDEYQDSNRAQFDLLKQLHEDGCYLCVVGDDDQSIYKFRGAVVENILGFQDAFPGTQIVRLERNYRSTQSILDVADAVVSRNRGRLGKTLVADRPGGQAVTLRLLDDQDAEARFVADLVRDGRQTAVLYRMNHQSRAFESALTRLRVRYTVVGTVRFFERAEIKDTAAYLSLLVNPRDEVAFLRSVNHPARGVGRKTRERILAERGVCGGDLLAACRRAAPALTRAARVGIEGYLSLLDAARSELETLPLSQVVENLLVSSGLAGYYRTLDGSERGGDEARSEGGERSANLRELVGLCAGRPGGADGLCALLEEAALESEGRREAEDPWVTLITLHATKGLEFERVVITGLEDGIFPMIREGAVDLEEERRLFYVGITRAKSELYLTACRRRLVWGRTMEMAPSRFLTEIPVECLAGDIPRAGAENDPYPVGCAVYHEDYGRGVISEKWESSPGEPGSETVAVVRFDTGKSVRFVLRFTRLEKVAPDDP